MPDQFCKTARLGLTRLNQYRWKSAKTEYV